MTQYKSRATGKFVSAYYAKRHPKVAYPVEPRGTSGNGTAMLDDERPTVAVADEWEYPAVRLPDGTDLNGEQVRALVTWYWESGQGDEDLAGTR